MNNYWKIEELLNRIDLRDEKAIISEVKKKLIQSVKNRLVSDVPLGTFLSGGTDSSLITAIASQLYDKKIKTFNIGFKENKFDESKYAKKIANHLGTDHCEYILNEKEAINILETYLSHFDEPFADTSAIPTMLISHLARKEVTVALTDMALMIGQTA